jgi:NAD(P)-dependent dehydrogenase (short-subunit alcohol dehydrogenase family)
MTETMLARLVGLSESAGALFRPRVCQVDPRLCAGRVNTISPGYIGTKMVTAIPKEVLDSKIPQIPLGRLGAPGEIAGLSLLRRGRLRGRC